MRNKSKTSVEILEERDALHARVFELEASLLKVQGEIEHALRHPEQHFISLCRIRTVVRGALPDSTVVSPDASEREIPGPPISSTRPTLPLVKTTRSAS